MPMAENRYTFMTSSGVRGDTVVTAFAGIDSGSTLGCLVTTWSPDHPETMDDSRWDTGRPAAKSADLTRRMDTPGLQRTQSDRT
jgi:hypothetical protein